MRRCRALITCLLLLTGCGDTGSAPQDLQEYLNRLSTITGMPLPAGPSPQNESLALPHDPILNPPAPSQINLIEFLSLFGCELQVNLGRRNTQLGAPPLRLNDYCSIWSFWIWPRDASPCSENAGIQSLPPLWNR